MQADPAIPQLVGLVVEGEAEVGAIPQLLRELIQNRVIRLSAPAHFHGQPVQCAPNRFREFIRNKIVPLVRAAMLKQVSLVVVLIDREDREQCPGAFAQDMARTIVALMESRFQYDGMPRISVVCADRRLENWLVADPSGLCNHAYLAKDLSTAVGNNADGKDALTLLKGAYRPGRAYHKRMDASRLAKAVCVMKPEVRHRSKSLDKFLRELGVPSLC